MVMPVLEPFVRQWAVLLVTYKRDGTPVGTPVSIAVEGERAFVRTRPTHKVRDTWLSQTWRQMLVRGILLNLRKNRGARSGEDALGNLSGSGRTTCVVQD